MAHDFTFTLSPAATDLLWEQLELGTPPALFDLPSVGETLEDRARLRAAVHCDLTERRLADGGRPDPDVADALTALVRFGHAIEGAVLADQPPRVFRAATNGRIAVLAARTDQKIEFATFRPDGLVRQVLALAGTARPGPGRSVSYPDPEPVPATGRHARRAWPDDSAGVLRAAGSPATGHGAERRAAESILRRPRTRSGWFTVLGRDRSGRVVPAPQLVWFDTVAGRYLAYRRPGPDGQPWTTCTPADATRIGHQLVELVNTVAD
ncbi:MAG TPA: ESX secretion-associated protein EspG [Pseudonocardiaceae bacterium]|nr:ESX secretion-associated protein EspG [Pseudonocardiaceae bacterium]